MDQQPIPILPDTPDYAEYSLRAAYAKAVLNESLRSELNEGRREGYNVLPHKSIDDLKPADGVQQKYSANKDRVCIVGAGAAGLYIAMILKFLGIEDFDILEASDRVGGRCFTYEFPKDDGYPCPHNYYDIGAMRIPDIPTMSSTMQLIDILNLQKEKVPYIYSFPKGGPVPPHMYWYSQKQPDGTAFDDAITKVIASLKKDFNYKDLMALDVDNFSTRSWLMTQKGLTYEETEIGETSDTSTGLFDQAMIETICDYSDFQAAKNAQWYRLDGGMEVVTKAMEERLSSTEWPKAGHPSVKVTRKTPVVAMALNGDKSSITVTSTDAKTGKDVAQDYDMVFNTTAMAPLQRMDLQGLDLPHPVLTGIRALSYDRATKVAIKFKTRWWRGFYQNRSQSGGVSSSDLPVSNVVYPSWNDDEYDEEGNIVKEVPAVLMVSYSWAQDATRMGALVPDYTEVKPTKDDEIVKLCIQNLVKLWSSEYISHHAWAWSHDPYTGGAFALFGPGQFSHLYPPFMKLLCGRKLSICGEATSAHHAWISGALDSAYLSVWQWLFERGDWLALYRLYKSEFGRGPKLHVAELDETAAIWAVTLSEK
ncbi:L-amino acid oxidase [Dactylonectria estremocensis]|uniref:L-amino acid oxidase n=1 Tax=Dactylonectria estremocensis TaxID=1079267 RepID=A0A9P9J5U9_9HYPO|nr:L-amino acid oxidase [Dactylonectria estremocensis]